MIERAVIAVVAAVSIAPLLQNRASCAEHALVGRGDGLWAADAQRPMGDPTISPIALAAPNGKAAIVYSADGVYLRDGDKTTALQEVNEPPSLSEVLWAPDSKAFVITASDGGLVGTWHAHFYYIDSNEHAVSRDIAGLISNDARSFALCNGNQEVNIGAAGWLQDSSELLVVAQVPPHSSCANMGALMGFRIAVNTWKLEQTFGERALRSRFVGLLGSRLQSRTRS